MYFSIRDYQPNPTFYGIAAFVLRDHRFALARRFPQAVFIDRKTRTGDYKVWEKIEPNPIEVDDSNVRSIKSIHAPICTLLAGFPVRDFCAALYRLPVIVFADANAIALQILRPNQSWEDRISRLCDKREKRHESFRVKSGNIRFKIIFRRKTCVRLQNASLNVDSEMLFSETRNPE